MAHPVDRLSNVAGSGEQFELRRGDQHVVVVEVGAALRSYRVGERDVIDGFAADAHADGARGQPLIPWPNRLRDGRYTWEGETHQLPLSEPANANAIHGLLRWRNWTVLAWAQARVSFGLRLHPMPGYPFTLGVTIEYELTDAGLRVRTRAENLGARACPYGVGFHPYLTLGGLIDDARLTVPAERHLRTDERQIPISSEAVGGTPFDFREPRAVGAQVIDTAYGGLRRDGDGRARVTLADDDASVSLWMGEAFDYVMVYTGDTLAPARRRRAIAVEPMSCAPNAFASGEGLVALAPREEHLAEWGIEV
jgi:aldose 1-epimerase